MGGFSAACFGSTEQRHKLVESFHNGFIRYSCNGQSQIQIVYFVLNLAPFRRFNHLANGTQTKLIFAQNDSQIFVFVHHQKSEHFAREGVKSAFPSNDCSGSFCRCFGVLCRFRCHDVYPLPFGFDVRTKPFRSEHRPYTPCKTFCKRFFQKSAKSFCVKFPDGFTQNFLVWHKSCLHDNPTFQ